jgi:hypothetical protein
MARPRKTPGQSTRANRWQKRSFHQELVLNRWVMGFFRAARWALKKLRYDDRTKASTKTDKPSSSMS